MDELFYRAYCSPWKNGVYQPPFSPMNPAQFRSSRLFRQKQIPSNLMKMFKALIVIVSLAPVAIAQQAEGPQAVADLVSKRDKALERANKAFMVEVAKLQSDYSKNGDVESAKKLAALIEESAGKDFKDYPLAARRVAASRDKDFKRINEIFIQELIKLQNKYTASGDFEHAKKVAALIRNSVHKAANFGDQKALPKTEDELKRFLIGTSWNAKPSAVESGLIFYRDGRFKSPRMKTPMGKFVITSRKTMSLVWSETTTIKCEFSDDFSSFKELNGERNRWMLLGRVNKK